MTGIKVDRIDHIVLTVADIEKTCEFYGRALGMKHVKFGDGRIALTFGQQKINLHRSGNEYDPKARNPMPGSGDICFISESSIEDVISYLEVEGIEIIEGPARKTGAIGSITSIYFRDPDFNLIEVSSYD